MHNLYSTIWSIKTLVVSCLWHCVVSDSGMFRYLLSTNVVLTISHMFELLFYSIRWGLIPKIANSWDHVEILLDELNKVKTEAPTSQSHWKDRGLNLLVVCLKKKKEHQNIVAWVIKTYLNIVAWVIKKTEHQKKNI